jgi:hypothetical protein
MPKPTDEDGYHTTDMYYAAYLKVANVDFRGTMREGKRVYFLFDNSDQDMMKQLRNEFFNRKSRVPALSYAEEIKVMKQLTHDESS